MDAGRDWHITVTVSGDVSDDDAAEIGLLTDAVVCTVERRPDRGQAEISFVIDANSRTLDQIIGEGLRLVEDMIEETELPLQIIGAQALTYEEWARRLDEPSERVDLIGAVEAAQMLGISRTRLHQLAEKHPGFPKPRHELTAGKLWARPDIEAFGKVWERRKGRPRKTA